MNPYVMTPDMNGEGLHIGIVRARFNAEIGEAELQTCLDELATLGVDERDVRGVLDGQGHEVPATLRGFDHFAGVPEPSGAKRGAA
ncbi:hypothetical protein CDEF62S_03729 [Castellaniella defragrans]